MGVKATYAKMTLLGFMGVDAAKTGAHDGEYNQFTTDCHQRGGSWQPLGTGRRTSMMRKLGAVVMVVLALGLAGCTTTTARLTGVVTGDAYPCVGEPETVNSPRVTVTVLLYLGGKVITSEAEGPRYSYRFTAAPGRYTVTFRQRVGTVSTQPDPPKGVVVRAGRTTTANIGALCA
jgi:hypothetical protein